MIAASPSSVCLTWFTSSYSLAGTTECVEVAHLEEGSAVRDSNEPEPPAS
nr:DUF397 domain-containing protein [Streptomyces sp. BpilaLS-43]